MAEITYSRIILRGLSIYGVSSSGEETLLFESAILPQVWEKADYYAYKSGVTFEVEPV